jgi:hypothetical protein
MLLAVIVLTAQVFDPYEAVRPPVDGIGPIGCWFRAWSHDFRLSERDIVANPHGNPAAPYRLVRFEPDPSPQQGDWQHGRCWVRETG